MQVPLICPVLLILASLLLFFGPIITQPDLGYLFSIGVLVLGAILWLLLVKYKLKIEKFGKYRMHQYARAPPENVPGEGQLFFHQFWGSNLKIWPFRPVCIVKINNSRSRGSVPHPAYLYRRPCQYNVTTLVHIFDFSLNIDVL